MRIVAGLVAGGVFSVAMALVGDLVRWTQRQVAIRPAAGGRPDRQPRRSTIAGVIGDLLGWRGVFGVLGLFGLIVAVVAFFAFRGVVTPPRAPFNRAAGAVEFSAALRRSTRQGRFTRVLRGDLSSTAVRMGRFFSWPSARLARRSRTSDSAFAMARRSSIALSVPVFIAVCGNDT